MRNEVEYRAFAIGTDGHYIRPYPFVAKDDDAAIKYARQVADKHELEIWSGERFVWRLQPNTS